MTTDLLFWVYLVNSVILINHEIDSAYWQEWKLVNPNDEKGISGFILLHFPMLFVILIGLVLVYEGLFLGLIISLLVSLGGIFCFFFHFYHLRKGRPEFNTILSKVLIVATFVCSIVQVFVTIRELL